VAGEFEETHSLPEPRQQLGLIGTADGNSRAIGQQHLLGLEEPNVGRRHEVAEAEKLRRGN